MISAICTALRWFCHSSSASPSKPNATIATSTSPPEKAASIIFGWLSVSRASKSISSTDRAPACFIAAAASSRRGSSGRQASTMRAAELCR
ncbi:Uncharacterised protein [Mycobacterium tuberculosis]|uniref:Uncharacterized protein n=1 Tax=Mycobacterium tuberculosis TaxID=1773 RepID=A0A654U0L7_MYCTX|nr:Uncharacterised protein [Mycobacterium tuberculosis]CNL38588.1 Uncharacterised protein [Mycobacterium tuberculosis]